MRTDRGMSGLRREWIGLNNVSDAVLRPAMQGIMDERSPYNNQKILLLELRELLTQHSNKLMQSNFNIDTSSLDADAFTAAGETIEDRLEEADLAQSTGRPGRLHKKQVVLMLVQKKPPQGNDRADDNDPRKDGVGFNP